MTELDPSLTPPSEPTTTIGNLVEVYNQDGTLADAFVVSAASPVLRTEGSVVATKAQTFTLALANEMSGTGEPLLVRAADDSWLPKPLDS